MTPESSVLAELRPLLDALCEESITPDQLARLEELVLAHPEAEQHYVRFMSFHADLIGTIAGLPERALPAPARSGSVAPRPEPPSPAAPEVSPPASQAANTRARAPETNPMTFPTYPSARHDEIMQAERDRVRRRARRVLWGVGGLLTLVLGVLTVPPVVGWARTSRELADSRRSVDASRADLGRAQADQAAGQRASRADLDAALNTERKLAADYQTALQDARKAIAAREFQVRLTGPTRGEPGAPNRWQIETLRHGAVARPKRMEVVVKDEKDTTLFRQTHDRPVGVATLDLPASFWTKVKTGSALFLEVNTSADDGRPPVLGERLPLARPVYVTHLATDKPLYQPGETVRFRSLTLDRSSLRPPAHDLHLRFRLRDPADAAVPLGEGNGRLVSNLRPVLGPDGRPVRGIGVGEHQLAPEAPGGEYKLDLFEVEPAGGKEVLLETRKFLVNRYVPDTFEKKLEFDGKTYGPGDVVQARVEVTRTAGGPMANARADVVASIEGREFHAQKGERFAVATGAGGPRAVLNVRFKLPPDLFDRAAQKDVPPNVTLGVTIRDGSDVEAIVRPVPLVTKTLSVAFFPEGGEMIEGIPGRVYFQVRTPHGKPADLKGVITDGAATVAEVATLTDAEHPGVNRGHGVFTLTPRPGARYFLKLVSPAGITPPTPDGFPLPAAKPDGVALTALDAVTARGAPVRARVQVGRGSKTLHVGAYARGLLIGQQRLDVAAGHPVDVQLPGDAAAGGVTRVTVFEELAGDGPGRVGLVPRAERLVYRVPGEQLVLGVKPDQLRYTPGGKVRLELSAVDERNAATPAVLLVGVVNRSVIAMADNKTDRLMPTHFLLSGEVTHPAELEHADFLLTDHPKAGAALDLLLGTQGWRRFAEQTGTAVDPADRKEVDRLLVAHGQRPSAPVELLKLEEQRVTADFRPKLEAVTLRVADAEDRWNAAGSKFSAALSTAQAAYQAAEARQQRIAEELSSYKARFGNVLIWSVLLILVVVGAAVLGWQALTATRPLAVGLVCLMLLGVWVAVMGLGSNVNSTFSFDDAPIKLPEAMSAKPMEAKAVPNAAPPPVAMARDAFPLPQAPAGGMPAGPRPDPKPAQEGRAVRGVDVPGAGKLPTIRHADEAPRDRELLGEVFQKRRIPGGIRGHGGIFGPGGMLAPGDEIGAIPPELLEVPPSVVREYAHQRDPALGDVRSDFTETVYWHPALVLPGTGKTTIEFQLADDIARYQVLVAGHTTDGRIGAVTTTIEARKPVSVDPKLPPEISHTDTVDVPVRVTNDSNDPRTVALSWTPTGLRGDGRLRESIGLGPNGSGRTIVRLKANKLQGEAGLVVEAAGGPAADTDAVARTTRIVPDGFPGGGSVSDMIESRARGTVVLPKDVVPGSLRVRLEVYPTSMADLVSGLDGLLREPSGCFEQTSTSNYPNVMILDYLNQTNQANPEAARRAKQLIDRGYARLTAYECPDTPLGRKQGFEWFGAADMAHEALTAYGLLQFKDMARVHPVDPELIRRTQAFLLSRRDGAGGFRRGAQSFHNFGETPKYTTDAYIVWALVESDPDDAERLDLKKEIDALKTAALVEDSPAGKDAYFVALTANVLLLRGEREAAHRLLDRLQEKHLKAGAVTGAVTSITRSGGRDLEIETTALTLLGWLRANDPRYAPAAKEATRWISRQRGGYGAFGSTQSTILALKALTLHAKKTARPAESGEFAIRVGGRAVAVRPFSEKDVEVIGLDVPNPEAIFRPGETTEVEIVTGAKQAYPFALGYTYTTLTPLSSERCAVKIGTKLARTDAREGETVALSVTLENRQPQGQGMAVAVVGLPAGLKVPTDLKQLTDLREKQQISYFEIRGRELILYWRELGPGQKVALSVDLVCDVPGTFRGPASRGYLYYNADHKHWVEPLSITIAPMGGAGGAR